MDHLEEVKKMRNASERVEYNCAQSILMPFSAEIGMNKEQAKNLGAFFGHGMMHGSTCGVLSSALMILGMKGYTAQDTASLIKKFRENHQVTDCARLLSIAKEKRIVRKDHCDGLVFEMCQILDDILSTKERLEINMVN